MLYNRMYIVCNCCLNTKSLYKLILNKNEKQQYLKELWEHLKINDAKKKKKTLTVTQVKSSLKKAYPH